LINAKGRQKKNSEQNTDEIPLLEQCVRCSVDSLPAKSARQVNTMFKNSSIKVARNYPEEYSK
jgi:hypothetical protein